MLSPHDIQRLTAILTDLHSDLTRAMLVTRSELMRSTLADYQSEVIGLRQRLIQIAHT